VGAGHQHGVAGALYVHGHSWVHRLPAHVKIVALVAFVFVVISTPWSSYGAFVAYAALLAVVAAVASVPALTVLRRMTIELPFVLFAVLMPFLSPGPTVEVGPFDLSVPGLQSAFNLLVKATLGVIASILLAATTTTQDLLLGFQRLRMPELMVQIASFMIRYAEVITSDMRRMSIARQSRCFDATGPKHWKVLGQASGALFIRSYERGERVHLAMLSRGFSGKMPLVSSAPAVPAQWIGALALPAAALVVLTVSWVIAR
jgi:cobalt/nickel transport system permease protein